MKEPAESGITEGVYIGVEEVVSESREEISLDLKGVIGDRHRGFTKTAGVREREYPKGTEIPNYRQVSIVATEELVTIADRLEVPEIKAEWLGANISVKDIPELTMTPSGTRLWFESGAVVYVYQDNLPCVFPGEVIQEHYPESPKLKQTFPKQALGLRGVVGWVERAGSVRSGDEVDLYLPRSLRKKK